MAPAGETTVAYKAEKKVPAPGPRGYHMYKPNILTQKNGAKLRTEKQQHGTQAENAKKAKTEESQTKTDKRPRKCADQSDRMLMK